MDGWSTHAHRELYAESARFAELRISVRACAIRKWLNERAVCGATTRHGSAPHRTSRRLRAAPKLTVSQRAGGRDHGRAIRLDVRLDLELLTPGRGGRRARSLWPGTRLQGSPLDLESRSRCRGDRHAACWSWCRSGGATGRRSRGECASVVATVAAAKLSPSLHRLHVRIGSSAVIFSLTMRTSGQRSSEMVSATSQWVHWITRTRLGCCSIYVWRTGP